MANTKKTNKKKISKKRVEQTKKRNLFIAIIAILFTGIVLTATTYAWFTSNNAVTVENVNVEVATVQGLQISVDAQDWKSVISNDDIKNANWKNADPINHIPDGMEPVSTVGNIDQNGLMEMFKGKIEKGSSAVSFANILTADKITESKDTKDFVAFDLFFQLSGSKDVTLQLDGQYTKVTSEYNNGIAYASRVGFVKLGHGAIGTATADLQEMNAGTTAQKMIWEPNFDVHTDSGVKHAFDIYGATTQKTGATKLPYDGLKAVIRLENNVLLNTKATDQPGLFGTVTTVGTAVANTTNLDVFTLSPGVTKIRVYMWVEGQDVDCENNASGDNLTYSLKFSIPETNA